MIKVIVSHPGRQHSHQLVYALQEGDMLLKYFTGFWYKPHNILKKIPKLEKEFKKRYFEKINPEFVSQNPFSEIKYRFILKEKNNLWFKIGKEFDKWVAKKLKNLNFDIFIGYELSSLESFKIAKDMGKICIYDLPSVAYNFQREIFRKYGKKYDEKVIETKEKELKFADYIFVPSEIVKESLIQLKIDEKKILKISYGIDTSKFLPKSEYIKNEALKIIFVGSITWHKGIEILLKAVSDLKQKINFELNLVGGMGDTEEILEKYKGLYKYHSYIPNERLPAVYRENDIFVFPSLLEGFAQVVLEAMVCGLPVIITENVGAKDCVRDGIDGFIIPPGDVYSLKEKILYFYHNREKIEEMGKNAVSQARKYTWERYREKVREIIRRISYK